MGDGYERSPNVGNGNNVRNVNTSGNINNNNANNSNGVAPDCMNSQNGVGEGSSQKPVHSSKERSSRSGEDPDEHTYIDAVSIRAGTAIHNMDPKEKICSFEELFKAMYICKQNVMWKDSVAGFVKNGLIEAIIASSLVPFFSSLYSTVLKTESIMIM